ncbi:MAG: bifunctional hydroxymethylpyrimidine kinase/phosphomethylpyrimidine kinase [Proteobacteria bacterium]|nr:bifunctional hydroxymethylpyrimidine kinase/phosphomethylpyrimidine kinase [Pseudomonadota bacterium]
MSHRHARPLSIAALADPHHDDDLDHPDAAIEDSEAFRALCDLARKRTGAIPEAWLARHVLGLTPGADWPLQRAALEALLQRLQFARRDGLLVRRGPARRELFEAAAIAPAELEQLRAAFRARAPQARVIVLSGSLPPGCPAAIYGELLAEAGAAATIVDAHGPALLAALAQRPTFVKPNRQELARTLGRELASDEALRRAMQELNRRGARWVVVSDGPRALWVSGRSGFYRCDPPPVPVVNPIGGGDALAGGIACGLQRGRRSLEAVRLGLAVALASVGTALPAELDPARVEALEAALCLA